MELKRRGAQKMKKLLFRKNVSRSVAQFLSILALLMTFVLPKTVCAQSLAEGQWLAKLSAYTHDSNDLAPVLGNAPFGGRITGLNDPSAYVRGESGNIILEFGKAEHAAVLYAKSGQEQDPRAKETLYLAGVQLQYKYAKSSKEKEDVILRFLSNCTQANAWIPERVVRFALDEVKNTGMQNAAGYLQTLKAQFSEDAQMSSDIDNTLAVLNLYRSYGGSLESVCRNVLAGENTALSGWALDALMCNDSPANQAALNNILISLFSVKKAGVFALKRLMDDNNILRSENSNPCFESIDSVSMPANWQITRGDTRTKIIYPAADAASYAKCVGIKNVSGNTLLLNSAVNFSGSMPLGIEYGFSYKTALPDPGVITGVNVSGPTIVKLRVHLTFSDAATQVQELAANKLTFGGWEKVRGEFRSQKPVISAQLEIIVSGATLIYLDDAYVRRDEKSFVNAPPLIQRVTVSQPAVLLQPASSGIATDEYVTLRAQVTDSNVTGRWWSNLQGDLGTGLEIMVRFTEPGEHMIIFTARGSMGAESTATTQIRVAQPEIVLTTNPFVTTYAPVSGSINVGVQVKGLEGLGSGITIQNRMYVNDTYIAVMPPSYTLDTRLLPNGLSKLQAKAYITLPGSKIQVSYLSNMLFVYINNAGQPVIPTLTITLQPQSQTVNAGSNATFKITSTGTAPLIYQWKKGSSSLTNGGRVSGTNTATLTIATVAATDAGSYSCLVTNSAGKATSAGGILTVNQPPAITTGPSSQTVKLGNNAIFSIKATGAALTYQWQKKVSGAGAFANINGVTSTTYTFISTSGDNGAQFRCIVTNSAGSAVSVLASLTVSQPSAITTQPSSQTVILGKNVTFSISASGTAPLIYQWKKGSSSLTNGGRVSGTNTAILTIATVAATDAGSYSCLVTNSAGKATSVGATLTVNQPPAITTQPANQTVNIGNRVTFSIKATGTAPLTYQWMKTSSAGVFTGIPGATSVSYAFTPVATDNGAQSRCIVTNSAGSATSNAAGLTVNVTLTITARNGAVTKKVNGQATTATSFKAGTVVGLTATANSGYSFSIWSGDVSGSAVTTTITMDKNKSVSANLSAITYNLTLTAQTGGTVIKSPNKTTFAMGERVVLTARPTSGYTFSGWRKENAPAGAVYAANPL
ncbi:MAG: immunoglobulin domain-containing protein, partial [Candidatus Omnitrophica bacterium]|nr:immunoglobulin domain-containing protein [Candidatus Omnitrophota bacterium]